MSETFLYEVVPHRPIRGLVSGKAITRPMVLLLDKEDVIECLRKATVYRRFSSNKREKVTAYTVNRFHRKEFISEESFKRLQEYEAKKEISEQTFEPAKPMQDKDLSESMTDTENAVNQEELKDEVDKSVPEETVEESVTEEVTESETTEEEIEEEMAEEVSEEVEKKENEEPSGSDDSLEETQNSESQQQKPRARAKARTKNRR